MKRTCATALVVVMALTIASCSRDSSTTKASDSGSSGGTTSTAGSSSGAADATALAQGGFGSLEKVCQAGTPTKASDKGVTATEIHVGTVTDKGASVRPGLDKEMYDAAVAFTKWCNEHGGINGRKLVLDDRDAKLFEYNARITESCEADFALVGGGAVVDDDAGARVACGLPNIAGYVVTPQARVADLQVQPLPNPVYKMVAGYYRALDTIAPGSLQAYGVLSVGLPATKVVRDASIEAVTQLGGKVVYSAEYNAAGESNWTPFVEDMKAKGVRAFEMVGEPENLTNLQKAMDTAGWYPDVTIQQANFYDEKYAAEGGKLAKNTYVHTAFTPFSMAADNKATQDYLDLIAKYNAGGKIGLLGEQSMSSYLLFARAAAACGDDLTRACLMTHAKQTSAWTGGGLHGATDPGANSPTPCYVMLKVTDGGFEYDKAATKPDTGIFNCAPTNVITLEGDYGVPR